MINTIIIILLVSFLLLSYITLTILKKANDLEKENDFLKKELEKEKLRNVIKKPKIY